MMYLMQLALVLKRTAGACSPAAPVVWHDLVRGELRVGPH